MAQAPEVVRTRAVSSIVDVLLEAGIAGPQIIYVDSTGTNADLIILTRDIRHSEGSYAPVFTDRERTLIRALLHLAQDRLDKINPHD